MSEDKLYQKFKNLWPCYINRIHISKHIGFPDIHLVNEHKNDVLLELKFLKNDFKNRKLSISDSQIAWHARYTGQRAFMLFEIENKYYLIRGDKITHLKQKITKNDFINCCSVFEQNNLKTIVDFIYYL